MSNSFSSLIAIVTNYSIFQVQKSREYSRNDQHLGCKPWDSHWIKHCRRSAENLLTAYEHCLIQNSRPVSASLPSCVSHLSQGKTLIQVFLNVTYVSKVVEFLLYHNSSVLHSVEYYCTPAPMTSYRLLTHSCLCSLLIFLQCPFPVLFTLHLLFAFVLYLA